MFGDIEFYVELPIFVRGEVFSKATLMLTAHPFSLALDSDVQNCETHISHIV